MEILICTRFIHAAAGFKNNTLHTRPLIMDSEAVQGLQRSAGKQKREAKVQKFC